MTRHRKSRADEIVDVIREYTAEYGFAPSVRDIAVRVDLASTSAVAPSGAREGWSDHLPTRDGAEPPRRRGGSSRRMPDVPSGHRMMANARSIGYNDWDGMSVNLDQSDTVRDGRAPLIPECGRFVSGG